MTMDIETFHKDISALTESDYGDFMRVANFYLTCLRENLAVLNDYNINKKIAEMQAYLQFTPNWDVESTRDKLLRDAKYINELLLGHRQDWESASI